MDRHNAILSICAVFLLALAAACGPKEGGANGGPSASGAADQSSGRGSSGAANSSAPSEGPRAARTFKEEKISFLARWTKQEEGEPGVAAFRSFHLKASQDGPETETFAPNSDIWAEVKIGPVRQGMQVICRVTAVKSQLIKAGDQIEYALESPYEGYTSTAHFVLSRPPQGSFPKGDYRVEILIAPEKNTEPNPAFDTNFTVQ